MALEFVRTHIIGRQSGHSAVKAAAYRAGETLFDAHQGLTANYSHRRADVLHSEILLPEGADTAFADRTFLWNAVELREDQHNRRASAQLAKDHIIALPKELTHAEHVLLARGFAAQEFLGHGLVVDLNVHGHSEGNPHAHLMVTTRALKGNTFGLKCRELNGGFYGGRKVTDAEMLKSRWADYQEAYFKSRELDIGVMRNEGAYPAELHLGVAHAMAKEGKGSIIKTQNDQRIAEREAAVLANPGLVIERVSRRKSVFTAHDLYREASQLVREPETFARLKIQLDAHELLIRLNPESKKAVYTTQSVIDTELEIAGHGEQLSRASDVFSGINPEAVLSKSENDLLSQEQREAVRWVSSDERLCSVVGLAGAGKSTTLGAARAVFEAHGHAVRGIALAGKAAEELQGASGIASSTIHSWLYRVEDGREKLSKGDVIVLDEAGMVDNALMHRVITQVNQSGAKLVMVGDPEQLQPIQAGRPFRELSARFGYTEISIIRRQKEDWQREASLNLARSAGDVALKSYEARGFVHALDSQDAAIARLVNDYLHDVGQGGSARRHAVLTHSNAAVDAMNGQIRAGLFEQELLGKSQKFTLETRDAEDNPQVSSIELGVGERVLFTKNDTKVGVKNGTLGEIVSIDGDRLQVKTDNDRAVSFSVKDYAHLKHGYAMTIHKSQGITVDRTSVLATPTMNKHLGYVAMSRHRTTANLYYGRDDFAKLNDLATRFTQVERAESVTEFAHRHGVALESGKRIEPVLDVAAAQKQLDESSALLFKESVAERDSRIEEAQQATKKAERAYKDHTEINRPKPRRFGSNRRYDTWKTKEKQLGQVMRSANIALYKLNDDVFLTDRHLALQAERAARSRHPDAVKVLEFDKASKQLIELVGRVEELEVMLETAQASGRVRSSHYRPLDRAYARIQDLVNKHPGIELPIKRLLPDKSKVNERRHELQLQAKELRGLDRGRDRG